MTDTPSDTAPLDDNGVLWPVGRRIFQVAKSGIWVAPPLAALMLLVHFWRAGHLPALSFSELGVVVAAFGVFVAMGLTVALLLILCPVWMLFSWTSASLLPAPPKGRGFAQPRRRRSLSRRRSSVVEPDASPARRRTFSLKVVPGGFGLFFAASATAIALSMAALLAIPPWLSPAWRSAPLGVLFAVGVIVPLAVEAWGEIGLSPRALRRMRRTLPQFLLLLSLYLFLWPVWMALLVSFDAFPASRPAWLMSSFFALLMVPTMHWLWYATLRRRGELVTEIRVGTSVFVLLYGGLTAPLIDGAASAYGFGMLRKVDLLLSARGCAIVQEALPGQACVPAPTAGDADTRVYRLRGVDVLTRIGADHVIAPAGGIDDRTLPRVTVPADDVVALIRRVKTAP